jgi:hypothetical protein
MSDTEVMFIVLEDPLSLPLRVISSVIVVVSVAIVYLFANPNVFPLMCDLSLVDLSLAPLVN